MTVAALTSARGRVGVDELLEVPAEDRGLDAEDERDGVHQVRLPGALREGHGGIISAYLANYDRYLAWSAGSEGYEA